MRRTAFVSAAALALFLPGVRAGDKKVDVSKIHGRIQFVKSFPDYRVQAVKSFPDLRVEIVQSSPSHPGQWQIVESFPDHKIEMVESFPDFTIQFVKVFPARRINASRRRSNFLAGEAPELWKWGPANTGRAHV